MQDTFQDDATEVAALVESVRHARNEFLLNISAGKVTSDVIAQMITDDGALHQLYVVKIAESIPHLGKVSARRALGKLGINDLAPAISLSHDQWQALFVGGLQ